jgi:hypothetical protein
VGDAGTLGAVGLWLQGSANASAHQCGVLLACACLQVDYYLALEADRFIGNSVSTFSAFVILERQWQDRCVLEQWVSAMGSSRMAGRFCGQRCSPTGPTPPLLPHPLPGCQPAGSRHTTTEGAFHWTLSSLCMLPSSRLDTCLDSPFFNPIPSASFCNM